MNKKKKNAIFYRKWKNYASISGGKCDECDTNQLYYFKYDADFCPQCNKWISKDCGDPNCYFCDGRPETPEHALVECDLLLEDYRASQNIVKEHAIWSYAANEKHRKRKGRLYYSQKE